MRSFEKSKQAYTEAVELMPGGVNSRFVPLNLSA